MTCKLQWLTSTFYCYSLHHWSNGSYLTSSDVNPSTDNKLSSGKDMKWVMGVCMCECATDTTWEDFEQLNTITMLRAMLDPKLEEGYQKCHWPWLLRSWLLVSGALLQYYRACLARRAVPLLFIVLASFAAMRTNHRQTNGDHGKVQSLMQLMALW